MPDRSQSPAVQSLRREQNKQRLESTPTDLDKGLEDTFPASDPVSATHTAISAVPVLTEGARDGSGQRGKTASQAIAHIEKVVRERPITAIAVAAAMAFLFGATR